MKVYFFQSFYHKSHTNIPQSTETLAFGVKGTVTETLNKKSAADTCIQSTCTSNTSQLEDGPYESEDRSLQEEKAFL